jgi:hypothetical protein
VQAADAGHHALAPGVHPAEESYSYLPEPNGLRAAHRGPQFTGGSRSGPSRTSISLWGKKRPQHRERLRPSSWVCWGGPAQFQNPRA